MIRTEPNNEQQQAEITSGPTRDLSRAMDDQTTTPSGMKLAMKAKGVAYKSLMTACLPPHLRKCIPTPDTSC